MKAAQSALLVLLALTALVAGVPLQRPIQPIHSTSLEYFQSSTTAFKDAYCSTCSSKHHLRPVQTSAAGNQSRNSTLVFSLHALDIALCILLP
jgi:hypothetical protein